MGRDYSGSRRQKLPSYVTDHSYAQYIGPPSNSWIDCLSYGGLTKPSVELLGWVNKLEKEFLHIHGDTFENRFSVKKHLISTFESVCPLVPLDVIQLYSKFRIYARCRFLNKKRLEAAILKRIENRKLKAMAFAKTKESLQVNAAANVCNLQTDDLSRSKNKKMKKIIV